MFTGSEDYGGENLDTDKNSDCKRIDDGDMVECVTDDSRESSGCDVASDKSCD